MIRPLRQRHRRIFAVLGIVLPIAFAVGVAARKPVPGMDSLPAEFEASLQPMAAADREQTDIFSNVPVSVYQLRDRSANGRLQVFLSAEEDFVKPDLLVYWLPGNPTVTDRLPEESLLIGALGSPALPLPEQAAKSNGVMLLYSLADGEIVAVSRPVQFDDSAR